MTVKKKATKSKAKPRAKTKQGTSKTATAQRKALFIEAMVTNGGNQTQAAITAGFPEKSAHVRGAELVKDRKVLGEIELRRKEALHAARLTANDVINSLARALRFDPRKLYREDGSLKAVHELDYETADALAGLEVVEMAGGMQIQVPAQDKDGKVDPSAPPVVQHVPMYTKKVKWLDKNAAREQGMKHFGLFDLDNVRKLQLTGLDGGPIETKVTLTPDEAYKRMLNGGD